MDEQQLAIMPTRVIEQKPLIQTANVVRVKEIPPVSVPCSSLPCSNQSLDGIMTIFSKHVHSLHHLKKSHKETCKKHRETEGRSLGEWIFFVLDLPLTIVLYLTALPPNKKDYCRKQALVWCVLGPGTIFPIKKFSCIHPYGIPIRDRHSAMALCLVANIRCVADNIFVEPWT